ncbi:hypothetical protein SDC9_151011 [bioreactor metagenome]|uniref:Uncharacterized protein n=1 Tax=bioreactor metagenome TaxID=1076179 RepID=A0A645EPN0_9ZZZZ
MRLMLKTLQEVYHYPVDIEFTVNFSPEGEYLVNLLQCRPLQICGQGAGVEIPELPDDRVLFSLTGNTMGGGADLPLDYVVSVDPARYYESELPVKYALARAVGELNRALGATGSRVLLLGPGRWATSSPELGVPVSFAEISRMAAICEVSYEGGHIMPELSYGSHFFQDLVETGMFYAAIFENRPECVFRPQLLETLPEAKPDDVDLSPLPAGLLRVSDARGRGLALKSDIPTRRTVCALFS